MRHRIVREGLVAGVLGATAVAVLFFFVDLIAGHPLATPTALGRALLRVFGPPVQGDSVAMLVAAYTAFHYVAFVVVGLIASVLVHWGEREPSVLAGAFILFIAIEIGFSALSYVLTQSPVFGRLSWIEVAVGNLVAATVMGTYLWRANPELRRELDLALSGAERRS